MSKVLKSIHSNGACLGPYHVYWYENHNLTHVQNLLNLYKKFMLNCNLFATRNNYYYIK